MCDIFSRCTAVCSVYPFPSAGCKRQSLLSTNSVNSKPFASFFSVTVTGIVITTAVLMRPIARRNAPKTDDATTASV